MRAVVHSGWRTSSLERRDQEEAQDFVARAVADPRRVAAVRRLVPLYRPPSDRFDRLTRLAAHLLGAPIALLTLVDSDREFFVSSYGLDESSRSTREMPLEDSLCPQAVASGRPLIVADFATHPGLADHPAAKEFGIRAYAGIPLITPDYWAVGVLCVLDVVPRDWTDDQLANLDMLASICMDEIRFACLDRQSELNSRWGASVGAQAGFSESN
jgi:GAF domain-containing protein